jgi:pSer/pThr/pTyr-binding forkhead associated (FHA) protein
VAAHLRLIMAKLVVSRDGAVVDQRFLERVRLTVGRDPASGLVIDDPAVRDLHAAIVAVGNDYILEDLAGDGGVDVNGTPVQRRILQHGDVVALGAFHMRFVDARGASEIDLERTMLISGLRPEAADTPTADETPVPATRGAKARLPHGRVRYVGGARDGEVRELDRVVATFGTRGAQVAVVTRRPQGFFLTHVTGGDSPRVNGESIGASPRLLRTGDVIEVGGDKLAFAAD